jgi:hypothetical protein
MVSFVAVYRKSMKDAVSRRYSRLKLIKGILCMSDDSKVATRGIDRLYLVILLLLKVYSSHLNWGARLYSFDLLLNTRCPASL